MQTRSRKKEPRAEKVAVVEEVRNRLAGTSAAVVTEYRGLTVAQLAELRHALAAVGGDYRIYKNTLVRRAIAGTDHEKLADLLTGPTALTFVSGELNTVAKALRDFARLNPALVVRGGQLGTELVSAATLSSLADLPSRDVLLGQLGGAFAAPLRQLAGLMEALPRKFAYALSALIDQRRGAEAP